jgi:Holliday junction resolvase RusA-like endonuclease
MAAAVTNNQPFVADTIAVLVPTDEGQPQKAERLDIVIEGTPCVQERTKISSMGRLHLYDPSSKSKAKFKWAVFQSLKSLKFDKFPIFKDVELKVTVVFHISNWLMDVDNLLKFVMDALEKIVYINDKCVNKIEAEKVLDPEHGFTTITVEVFHPVHTIHHIE